MFIAEHAVVATIDSAKIATRRIVHGMADGAGVVACPNTTVTAMFNGTSSIIEVCSSLMACIVAWSQVLNVTCSMVDNEVLVLGLRGLAVIMGCCLTPLNADDLWMRSYDKVRVSGSM